MVSLREFVALGRGGVEADMASIDWRLKMSNNVAHALLVYTALQIFVTMGSLHAEGGSLLPYVVLVILVGAIIPACRSFERKWSRLSEAQAHDAALAGRFAQDRKRLWLLAAGLPFLITAVFRLLAAAFLR